MKKEINKRDEVVNELIAVIKKQRVMKLSELLDISMLFNACMVIGTINSTKLSVEEILKEEDILFEQSKEEIVNYFKTKKDESKD